MFRPFFLYCLISALLLPTRREKKTVQKRLQTAKKTCANGFQATLHSFVFVVDGVVVVVAVAEASFSFFFHFFDIVY